MSVLSGMIDKRGGAALEGAIRGLVSVRDIGDKRFISLPMLYPDGSNVTVAISPSANGIRVSDNGFAYLEAENIGAERSFGRLANGMAEALGLDISSRAICVDAEPNDIYRAICDVASVSWRVVSEVYDRAAKSPEDFGEELRDRLRRVFGDSKVSEDRKITGASTSEWEVSAIVRGAHGPVIFQAVRNHANSIFRTVTEFGDIASIDAPPQLVAVVPNKGEMGRNLSLLSRGAKVIEMTQSDDVFMRSAA